uniref:Uncharacterized protein n=1 Tax=Anguilla anguilla TaxID=7936 RepID=A0A0E9T513_ANGAN
MFKMGAGLMYREAVAIAITTQRKQMTHHSLFYFLLANVTTKSTHSDSQTNHRDIRISA